MNKYFFIFLVFLNFHLSAQELFLEQLTAVQPVEVVMPYLVDTVNRKKEKFKQEDLLKLPMPIPGQDAFINRYKADSSGFIYPNTLKGKSSIQLLSFYIHSDQYAEADLKITSPNLLEVYVEGKLQATKKTTEDSVHIAKNITFTCTPYPQSKRIVIKLLANQGAEAALKIQLKKQQDKTNAFFHISYDSKRPIILDDVIKGKRISDLSISPNGNYALLNYTNTHGTTATYTTELYSLKTGRRILIDTDRRKIQLQWMPKTEKLYYLQPEGKQSKLKTIDPETLEEKTWAEEVPYEHFIVSPDEKTLFYAKYEEKTSDNDVLYRLRSLTERANGEPVNSFIYQYDLQAGISRQLTFGSHTTYINDISPDGRFVLFSIVDEIETERPFSDNSLFCLNRETMQVDTLWEHEKYAVSATFSPQGDRILILGSPEAFEGIGLNVNQGLIPNKYDRQAYIMNLSDKSIEPITKNFNPSIQEVYWNKQDGLIYFQVVDEDYVKIYAYQPSTKKYTQLPLKEEVVNTFKIADKSSLMLYYGTSVSNSTRAYVYNLKNQKSQLIADPYSDQLSQLTLGEVKDWNFMNSAGVMIKGRFYLPPNFDPTRKYPMIVNYYGGTTPVDRRFESRYPLHVYAALGYVVYLIQPSGAIGFGQNFSALHVNTWGKRSSDDVIEGTTQFLKEHSFIDEKKIGCIGASYGGFMTMYLQTRTDLFAAAVSHAGISSISSYWGEGNWGYSYSATASADSYPWNNRELYVEQSPLFHADKINTPILLIHGTSDTNVPVGESIQMYTALKILGKPVELIQVKGENHQILSYEKRQKWNNTIFAWFDKWLKDQPTWWESIYKDQ